MANGEQEKPFFWLPLKEQPRRTAPDEGDNHQRTHEGRYSGSLRLGLKVSADYLHVGGGGLRTDRAENGFHPYQPFATFRGGIIIPGSGIKGPVRTLVEAFSNSCVRVQESDVVSRNYKPCNARTGLCPACRMFGSTGQAGRVRFDDAGPVGNEETLQHLTQIVKIAELFGPNASPQRKFYVIQQTAVSKNLVPERTHAFIEVVPKDTLFITTLYFDNLSNGEIGLLLRALGFDLHPSNSRAKTSLRNRFPISLGGAKPRALGAVKVLLSELRLRGTSGTSNYFTTLVRGRECDPEERRTLLQDWVSNISLLDHDTYQQFCKSVSKPDSQAPEGVY